MADPVGPLAIHAGKAQDMAAAARLAAMGVKLPALWPSGQIIGLVDVLDCVRGHDSRWAIPDMWHWVLSNPRSLAEPVVCRGQLGLFVAPAAVTDHVMDSAG